MCHRDYHWENSDLPYYSQFQKMTLESVDKLIQCDRLAATTSLPQAASIRIWLRAYESRLIDYRERDTGGRPKIREPARQTASRR